MKVTVRFILLVSISLTAFAASPLMLHLFRENQVKRLRAHTDSLAIHVYRTHDVAALERLIKLAEAGDANERLAAVISLRKARQAGAGAGNALADLLASKDRTVAREAAATLSCLGDMPPIVIDKLFAASQSFSDEDTGFFAVEAIGNSSDPSDLSVSERLRSLSVGKNEQFIRWINRSLASIKERQAR